MEYTEHYSVLKAEVLQMFEDCHSEKNYFADLTFGGGGHTFALAKKFEKARLFTTDQDPEAYKNGLELIKSNDLEKRITLLKTNFENFPELFKRDYPEVLEEGGLDGILLDIGVSNHQFKKGERGFSFRFNAPLDMRMAADDKNIKTARELVNSLSEDELERIFREYGEEKFSKRIAKSIVEKRSDKVIETTKDLEDIIFHSYPKNLRFGKTHPATKTFQALRIAVNRELDIISRIIPSLISLLAIGGRLAIISFHSLEDRIVKHEFKKFEKKSPFVKILTKRPIIPTNDEILENSKSRSAKLRVVERVLRIGPKNKYQKYSTIKED